MYVLNLDRCPARLADIGARLGKQGILFTRVSATDGQLLGELPCDGFAADLYRQRHGKIPNPNEVGCYLTHLATMRRFIQDDADFALILEDDAIFLCDLAPVLDDALANADAWDILTLYGNRFGAAMPVRRVAGGREIVGYWLSQTGSVGYLINRKAAGACLRTLLPMSLPYDHAFTRSWDTGVRFRGLVPFPLGSKGGPSTIGHTRKLRAWQRIPTAFFRANSTRSRFFHNLIAERLWLPAMLMMIRQLKEALVGARVGSTR